ncbi:DnaJ-domain-containing protein [Pseudovirgaria hyperparasitica]|uniref:DnaJ-domain-containing protein n=1 Tax=Pseudovirgaria hyperparasitica TaxID=470096 RepID=A0A6A6W6D9_9PEZI|nr:DnaJ-domain-containing protein [Pseudovirgaria hyperparasitica]KAF2758183.1 DnaJ-domain-containing protein [Pseudovirgaria hyperparasitica]
MGANQSSNTGSAGASQNGGEVKTSYYELLGVERQATDDELKKAYRRKALELHPDRNYGDVDRATKLFAEIQAAYEVLSDPQERAWYDSHEQIILRGGEPTDEGNYEADLGITSADEVTALMRKFNRNVDFSNSPSGFFGFLRDIFEKLAKEEMAAAHMVGGQARDYPSFGHKNDDYDDVVREFYAVWISFATLKTFSWKHKYRKSEADDRWQRRAVDKENARLAEQGRREFNEAVRTLVAFVRKRDPRYTPNTQTDDERAKAMRDAVKAQAARQRAQNEALKNQAIPEWATRRAPDELEESEEEVVEEEHFECMACKKTFKSEKQWDAHEKSKKHQKAVQTLKKKMRKENAHFGLDDDFSSSGGVVTPVEVEAEDYETAKSVIHPHANRDENKDEETGEDLAEVLENISVASQVENHGTKVTIEGETTINSPTPTSADQANDIEDLTAAQESDSEHSEPDSSEQNHKSGSEMPVIMKKDSDDYDISTVPRMGKAAQKRAKRAAKQAATDEDELRHKCAVCNTGFPSKTRLFQHINDLGHAAPVTATKGAKGKGGKGKRK